MLCFSYLFGVLPLGLMVSLVGLLWAKKRKDKNKNKVGKEIRMNRTIKIGEALTWMTMINHRTSLWFQTTRVVSESIYVVSWNVSKNSSSCIQHHSQWKNILIFSLPKMLKIKTKIHSARSYIPIFQNSLQLPSNHF